MKSPQMQRQAAEDELILARYWPTIAQVAAHYDVPARTIRHAIALQEIHAVKTNIMRVDLKSFARWLAGRRP